MNMEQRTSAGINDQVPTKNGSTAPQPVNPDLAAHFPIHPMFMRIDTVPSFSIYTQTPIKTYLLFHKGGEPYNATVHSRIFKESISLFYGINAELDMFYRYVENFLILVINDPFINSPTKARISHALLTHLARLVCEKPEADTIVRLKNLVRTVSDYVLKHKDAINDLISMTTLSYNIYNHLVNVGIYGMGLAREVLAKKVDFDMSEIAAGFFLHDIGINKIDMNIIHKQGSLSDEEWKIIKKHPEAGYIILKSLNLVTEETKNIILQHHERNNGKGYPRGLRGDQIQKYSKICSIADAFDAMTSYRPFRKAQKSFEALKKMHVEMKDEFDPELFGQFVLMFSKNIKK